MVQMVKMAGAKASMRIIHWMGLIVALVFECLAKSITKRIAKRIASQCPFGTSDRSRWYLSRPEIQAREGRNAQLSGLAEVGLG
jgi:hypothetical protein